jgi:hypothetical protein
MTDKSMAGLIALAKTLDVQGALNALTIAPPPVPRNSNGSVVSVQDWALSGLHSIRARPRYADQFTPEEVDASVAYLKANGWDVPA